MRELAFPENPYPGLLNYQVEQRAVFAGRDKDVKQCGTRLFQSNVLVLHGRTGCGKSSFLRAGLRPALQRSGATFMFPEDAELRVVRSSVYPLAQVASEIYQIAAGIINDDSPYGPGKKEAAVELIGERSPEEFIKDTTSSYRKTVKALSVLTDALRSKPIIVIDQAEEVFTLLEAEVNRQIELQHKGKADKSEERDPEKEFEVALKSISKVQTQYFQFLYSIAKGDVPEARLILSLRTEYKGELEERVTEFGHPGSGLKSYLLEEMKSAQLIDAIKRPTLKLEEYRKILSQTNADAAAKLKSGPFDKFVFDYEAGVPEAIARWLKQGKVPQGGLLPAMQVACLRLHQLTRAKAKQKALKTWTISLDDLRNLGQAGDQVREYLGEQVGFGLKSGVDHPRHSAIADNKSLMGSGDINSADLTSAQDQWFICLNELVRLQPDGRATTESLWDEDFIKRAETRFENRSLNGVPLKTIVNYMLDHLVKASILRQDDMADGRKAITLGHDSLALALNQWQLKYGSQIERYMKMGMNSPKEFAEKDVNDLFGEDKSEHPTEYRIKLPRDLMWDHQIPHFALEKKFASRLGILFEEDKKLSAVHSSGERRTHQDWDSLRKEIVDAHQLKRNVGRILVAGEFQSFPNAASEYGKWTDVLVTDVFQGYALVGERNALPGSLREYDLSSVDTATRIAQGVTRLRDIMMDLSNRAQKISILTIDEKSGETMLKLACELCGVKDDWVEAAILPVPNGFTDGDALYEAYSKKLLSVQERYAKSQKKGTPAEIEDAIDELSSAEDIFMLATAFGRAQAEQADKQIFFGASHLLHLVDNVEIVDKTLTGLERESDVLGRMALSDAESSGSPAKVDLARKQTLVTMVQGTMLHTLWQVGVPPSKWMSTEHRAFILRLAALGYYTAEYIRSSPDDFVNTLHHWINNEVMAKDGSGANRLNKDKIRESVQESFTFLTFDEFPRVIFDLDAPRAYYWEEKRLAKSTAHEIFLELCRLRAETLAHSERVTQHLRFFRSLESSSRKQDRTVTDAVQPLMEESMRYSRQAWLNYRIFNFYDSERMMRRAADHLLMLVEDVQKGAIGRGSDAATPGVRSLGGLRTEQGRRLPPQHAAE